MTTERAFIVELESTPEVLALLDDMRSASARARKADAGDRFDVTRFESLAARLEHLAATTDAKRYAVEIDEVERLCLLGRDSDQWSDDIPKELQEQATAIVSQGLVPVLIVDPFFPGPRATPRTVAVPPPAERWRDPDDLRGREAVEKRFRSQIEEALAAADGAHVRAIAPSGVQNAVVTEILREFAASAPSASAPVYAPVEYRDGSRSARPIALRALTLRSELDEISEGGLDLHFALLSIRHTEMDATVHGTWLRNAEISRVRPAAETDDLVYDLTRAQLRELTANGRRVRLHMYQTGLETAVVGFYKALIDHLLEHENSVAVQPMYFRNPPTRHDAPHDKSRKRQAARARRAPVVSASFAKGTPWQT